YAFTLWLEHHGDDDQGDDADRQIEQKNPLPGEMLDGETAEDRAGNGRYAEDGTEEALHLAALAGGNDVGDYGHGNDHEPATAKALNGAGGNEEGHRIG